MKKNIQHLDLALLRGNHKHGPASVLGAMHRPLRIPSPRAALAAEGGAAHRGHVGCGAQLEP